MLKLSRYLSASLRRDEGVAIVSVILVTMLMTIMITAVIANALHSNSGTTSDKHREDAFQAASAGVDDAMTCLASLSSVAALSTCSKAAGAGTQLSDAGNNIGQFGYTVTDITPAGQTVHIAKVSSTGVAPSVADPRGTRYVTAEITMVPVAGFFDTIFAGSNGAGTGTVSFKNNPTVNGNIYAASLDTQKNNGSFGDVRVVGDFTTQNNDTYNSIWSGGNVSISNNTQVATTAKACGAGASPGNATLSNGASVAGNLQYKGTLSNSGTVGSTTHAGCAAPTTLDIPSFTYSAANYPGWTIVNFTTVAAANTCLGSAGSTQAIQVTKCGVALGDANGTVGKNANGTLVYVNVASPTINCTTPVSMGGASYTGNFTLVSTCPLSLGGSITKNAGATGNKQVVFIETGGDILGNNGLDPNGLQSNDASMSVLLYSTGTIGQGQGENIASGAVYGRAIDFKNNVNIGHSADLGSNAPAGFTFDPSVASTFTPVVRDWRETAS